MGLSGSGGHSVRFLPEMPKHPAVNVDGVSFVRPEPCGVDMPLTLSYDLAGAPANRHNYLRSMLERFGWKRLGGSVFRYSGRNSKTVGLHEDWLNDVAPSLMFFRSYIPHHDLRLKRFTIDAQGVSFVDHSDPTARVGRPLVSGTKMKFITPTNNASAVQTLRDFLDASEKAAM
jgi:hypothetical protein